MITMTRDVLEETKSLILGTGTAMLVNNIC